MPDDPPVYRLREEILSVVADDETILMSVDGGRYYGIRGAMQPLLGPLRDGMTLDAMIDATCARYAVDRDAARTDIDAMLHRLSAAGILDPA